jgi:hypothetical protein
MDGTTPVLRVLVGRVLEFSGAAIVVRKAIEPYLGRNQGPVLDAISIQGQRCRFSPSNSTRLFSSPIAAADFSCFSMPREPWPEPMICIFSRPRVVSGYRPLAIALVNLGPGRTRSRMRL